MATKDNSSLTPQLISLEGWRVEVIDKDGDKPRRFIVGRSNGWQPCHLELRNNRRSIAGSPAAKSYYSVKELEKVK